MKSLMSFVSLAVCASAAGSEIPSGTILKPTVEEVQPRGKAITFEIKRQTFKKPLTARKLRLKQIREMKAEARRLANEKAGLKTKAKTDLELNNIDDSEYTGTA